MILKKEEDGRQRAYYFDTDVHMKDTSRIVDSRNLNLISTLLLFKILRHNVYNQNAGSTYVVLR